MIDLSDGLASDIHRICEESNVGAIIEAKSVPLSKGAPLKSALNDGEDFELLFTLSPREAKRLLQKKNRLGFQISEIGRIVTKEKGIRIHVGKTALPLMGGFRHF